MRRVRSAFAVLRPLPATALAGVSRAGTFRAQKVAAGPWRGQAPAPGMIDSPLIRWPHGAARARTVSEEFPLITR